MRIEIVFSAHSRRADEIARALTISHMPFRAIDDRKIPLTIEDIDTIMSWNDGDPTGGTNGEVAAEKAWCAREMD